MILTTIAISFLVMLFLGFPIAMATAIAGVVGLIIDPSLPSLVMAQKIFSATDSFALMAIPFFMLGGQLMEVTGITDELVKFAKSIVGHIRGGLAHTVIVSGVLMAGISGSQNADAAAIGAITLPALKRDGYDGGFAVSVVAAAGGLGPIIPPSIIMVIYCTTAGNLSIGRMFMAGVLPGLILAFGYMAIAYVYALRHNMHPTKFVGLRAVGKAFLGSIWALLMPVIIIGGILSGIVTATEAGVLACVYGLLYGLFTRRLNLKTIRDCLVNAVINTCGPMSIIMMCSLLGYLLIRQNLAGIIQAFVMSISSSPVVFYLILMVILVIAGMFIDGTATLLLLVPVLTPMIKVLGLNELHFGMVFLLALQTGGLTPPVGVLLFIVSSIGKVPLHECIRPIIPFILWMIIVVVAIIFIPGIVQIVPHLFGY